MFACLGNDDDVRSVMYGDDGAAGRMGDGAILVDHTTAFGRPGARAGCGVPGSAAVGFLDAPVSGGEAGCRQRRALTVMVGGEPSVFDRARPAIDCFAKSCVLMGPAGAGQLTKMVNQICIAGLLQGPLGGHENFAQKAGLDGEKRCSTSSAKGARPRAGRWTTAAKTMLAGEFEFGFAGRLDAQGPVDRAGRGAPQHGAGCR